MIEDIKKDLSNNLSKKRYLHTLRVVEECKKLAKFYGEDIEKTELAALLHDNAKFESVEKTLEMAKKYNLLNDEFYLYNKEMIHPMLGAQIAKDKYNIKDEAILDAIRYHTTGRRNMSLLEKIIFIGDYIEPDRKFSGIDGIRRMAFIDLDKSIIMALNKSLKFLVENDRLISRNTLETRNYLMIEKIKEREGSK